MLRTQELSPCSVRRSRAHAAATRGLIPDTVDDNGPCIPEAAWVRGSDGVIIQAAWLSEAGAIARPYAGYAIVALSAEGRVRAVVHGALPVEYPQIAAAVEAWAAVRVVGWYEGCVQLAADNALRHLMRPAGRTG